MEISFKFWVIIISSIFAGIFYRLGGKQGYNTKIRDLGIPTIFISLILWFNPKSFNVGSLWAYFLSFGLLFGSLSTYWRLDEKKWGYWAHSLGISFAVLPIAFITGHYLGFGIRCVVLTGLITLISEYISKDWLEEFLRGFLIIITLPLLLI